MLGIEEEANLIYLALATEKYAGNSDDISMKDIVGPLKEKYDGLEKEHNGLLANHKDLQKKYASLPTRHTILCTSTVQADVTEQVCLPT